MGQWLMLFSSEAKANHLWKFYTKPQLWKIIDGNYNLKPAHLPRLSLQGIL